MDKFKCLKCGKIFDEFEADYNFMSREGKELCPECIKKGYNTMSRCSICQAPKVLCTCKDEAEIVSIEEVKKQYLPFCNCTGKEGQDGYCLICRHPKDLSKKDCRLGLRELDEVCLDCTDFLPMVDEYTPCKGCAIRRLKERIKHGNISTNT